MKMYLPNNRSYLGNKSKLLGQLTSIINERLGPNGTFFDPFAGTGAVSFAVMTPQRRIIANDFLQSNAVSLRVFFELPIFGPFYPQDFIRELNFTDVYGDNEGYCEKNWGGKYFSVENARKIDAIRERIAASRHHNLSLIALSSLIYAVDKISWTYGHYDAFKKRTEDQTDKKLLLDVPNMPISVNPRNIVTCLPANMLLRNIKADVTFIDPPYNTRQYGDNYHLLENLVSWHKPKCLGKTMKSAFRPSSMWSSRANGYEVFKDFIKRLDTKHIIMTYNNQSGNILTDRQIREVLHTRGDVLQVHEVEHGIITTNKSSRGGNIERIYVIEVTK
jgi:adenine-specific DNA-methyltransferase